MKKILLCYFLVLVAMVAQANDYYVLHVKGEIKLKSTGQPIKPNDKVAASDEIVFATADAMAAVVSTEGGRMILKADNSGGKEGGDSSELTRFVKNNLLPATGRMSTRDAGVFTIDSDFIRHFTGKLDNNTYYRDQYVIIGEKETHAVADSLYPLDENHLFYVSYTYQGEAINKMLTSNKSAFDLNKETIYQVDENPIEASEASDFKLFYYDVETEESRLLCEFIPVFISEEEMKRVITPLIPYLEKLAPEQRLGEAKAYLADIYGKVGTQDLSSFLQQHFKLSLSE